MRISWSAITYHSIFMIGAELAFTRTRPKTDGNFDGADE